MADIVNPATRSRMMSCIRGRDTAPEMRVRQGLHAAGLRFRLHRADLPGRPDIVLPGRRVAIFVHGCFWHRHAGCRLTTTPATRPEFWAAKFEGNVRRDSLAQDRLTALGWRLAIIWECALKRGRQAATLDDLVAWIRSDSERFETDPD